VTRYVLIRGNAGSRWGVQAGAEYESNRASISDGSRLSTENTSAFLVVRVNPVDRLSLTGSLRYDDPSDVGGRLTGRASAVWRATDALAFNAAWGQGFKAPTISQLACDFCFPFGPSVGLRPERAEGYEAGVRLTLDRFRGSLTAYHLEVRDQIDFSLVFPFRYLNLKETRSNGVEARAAFEISEQWGLEAEYAWTDALDVAAQTQLLRIPEHAGSVSLSYRGNRLSGVLTVRAESDQADAGGRRDSFVVADLAGQYDLTRQVQLTARIENLADSHYQQALGYGEPGIAAYVGVRVRGG
jgi:vitamin B12 transporter